MRYKELINAGFERKEGNCSVWKETHGYKWFWLEKDITSEMNYYWCPSDKKLELIFHKEGKIKSRRQITDKEFEILEEVFRRKGDIVEESYKYTVA